MVCDLHLELSYFASVALSNGIDYDDMTEMPLLYREP